MDREIKNPFATIMRMLRGDTPQGVFAERLGLKQAKYSHYENKRREPSLDELCRIARTLNTTPNVLLGFDLLPQKQSTSQDIHVAQNAATDIADGIKQ